MTERFKHLSGESKIYASRVYAALVALDDFYEPVEAMAWMNSPQVLLNDQRPTDLLKTAEGTVQVMDVITRLRDGAYI